MNELVNLGTLVGGGDCLEHYHLTDRFPPRDTTLWLQSQEIVVTVSADYTVTDAEDIIIINGSGLTIDLPVAFGGKHIIFTVNGSNSATLTPASGETINGLSSYSLSSTVRTAHLKAVSGGWILI